MDGRGAAGIAMDYSEAETHSFHVASDKARVGSKSNGDAQHISEQVARGSFIVRKDTEMVYGAARRGLNSTCLPESVEERHEKDRVKKHYDFTGVIGLYVEELTSSFRETMQQSNTSRAIQKDTAAIRTLVRKGKERVKEYDHRTILRVVGMVINPEAWWWYFSWWIPW